MVVGAVLLPQLPVTQFPNIDVPIMTVTVGQPGAAPSEIVTQVTKPIENAISVDHRGQAHHLDRDRQLPSTTVEFELSTDSDRALNDVKDAVAQRPRRPAGRHHRAGGASAGRDRASRS